MRKTTLSFLLSNSGGNDWTYFHISHSQVSNTTHPVIQPDFDGYLSVFRVDSSINGNPTIKVNKMGFTLFEPYPLHYQVNLLYGF